MVYSCNFSVAEFNNKSISVKWMSQPIGNTLQQWHFNAIYVASLNIKCI